MVRKEPVKEVSFSHFVSWNLILTGSQEIVATWETVGFHLHSGAKRARISPKWRSLGWVWPSDGASLTCKALIAVQILVTQPQGTHPRLSVVAALAVCPDSCSSISFFPVAPCTQHTKWKCCPMSRAGMCNWNESKRLFLKTDFMSGDAVLWRSACLIPVRP